MWPVARTTPRTVLIAEVALLDPVTLHVRELCVALVVRHAEDVTVAKLDPAGVPEVAG